MAQYQEVFKLLAVFSVLVVASLFILFAVLKPVIFGPSDSLISLLRAKRIMGPNMLDVIDAYEWFGIELTFAERARLQDVPFSARVLKRCKDTHVLALVPAISVNEMRKGQPSAFFPAFHLADEPFANERGSARWCLVRKASVPSSTEKVVSEQLNVLDAGEVSASARIAIYIAITHFLATGERIFAEPLYARCADSTAGGERVLVGYFDAFGLRVMSDWGNRRAWNVGMTSMRKCNAPA